MRLCFWDPFSPIQAILPPFKNQEYNLSDVRAWAIQLQPMWPADIASP